MISNSEIEHKAIEFGVSPQNVERDYVHGWLLRFIYEHPTLSNKLVLKGGNGIRKGYSLGARYSKDLDFSCSEEIDSIELHHDLKGILSSASRATAVRFELDQTRVDQKRLNIPGVSAKEARVYFKGFYAEENITLRTHLDIGELEKTYLPVQARTLIHPYSDAEACIVKIRCHKLEEIIASKLTTLLFRRRAQDLFDLIFSIAFSPDLQLSRTEVIRTFLKKSIFDPEARQARQQLLAVPLELFRPLWASISAPTTSHFSFDAVTDRFYSIIDDLFGLLTPEANSRLREGRPVAHSFAFGGLFDPAQRQIIIDSGRASKTIEATYHGVRRVLEPYKLEFKIRKKDNRGFEYFYAWDQTGGRSSPPGLKSFFSDQLRDIVATNFNFAPRFEIEL